MVTVLVLGTLDTKGLEYEYLCERLRSNGVDPLVVDVGVLGEPLLTADVSREEVARAAGAELASLASRMDRGEAVSAMARGAAAVVGKLAEAGRIRGAIALGGTGGTAIASRAFRVLPLGVPKVIVSTAASGNTQMYVGETDLVLMPSVADIAGINRLSARIIANAAAVLAGMVLASPLEFNASKWVVGASNVRCDDAVCDGSTSAAGSAWLRSSRLPYDRDRRAHA